MKYNLKNKPVEIDKQGNVIKNSVINDWFEGFEKELRELHIKFERLAKENPEIYNIEYNAGKRDAYSEILGEES